MLLETVPHKTEPQMVG